MGHQPAPLQQAGGFLFQAGKPGDPVPQGQQRQACDGSGLNQYVVTLYPAPHGFAIAADFQHPQARNRIIGGHVIQRGGLIGGVGGGQHGKVVQVCAVLALLQPGSHFGQPPARKSLAQLRDGAGAGAPWCADHGRFHRQHLPFGMAKAHRHGMVIIFQPGKDRAFFRHDLDPAAIAGPGERGDGPGRFDAVHGPACPTFRPPGKPLGKPFASPVNPQRPWQASTTPPHPCQSAARLPQPDADPAYFST